MNISQLLTKLKTLVYSKSETDSLLGGKASSSHTHTKSQITDFPSLATVATSGSYNDLSNKPTIPTNTNQLTNGAGFITSSGSCNYANSAGSAQPVFNNGTWYAVGDDAAIGDHNVGGGLGVKALNDTTTRIDLCYKDDASNFKSITYDGTTLYMNGNCNYANSAGSSSIATRDSGGTWISGRDNAVVKQTRHSTDDGNSWNPAVSVKTKSGNWTIGTVGYDKLQFSYDTDEDYNTGNNRNTVVELNPESGTIITSANIGSQSVNYANSAGSAGSASSATTAGAVSTSVAADSTKNLVYSSMADNDFCRIMCGGASNAGYMEIATADDGNEPIYVRQYTGVFGSITRTLTLLDGSGNTQFPGTVSASTFIGNLNGNCDYATNSGYTNWLRTSSHTDHLFHTEWDGSYFWTYVTAGDGGYRAVRVERSNSAGWADSAGKADYLGDIGSTDRNGASGTGWYSVGFSYSYDEGHNELAINNYWGIRLNCRDSNHVTINGNRIIDSGNTGNISISGYQVYVG